MVYFFRAPIPDIDDPYRWADWRKVGENPARLNGQRRPGLAEAPRFRFATLSHPKGIR
jgi:hypothetical protein